MEDTKLTGGQPQFSTAEYANTGGGERCRTCNQPITGEYYRISNAMTCPSCAMVAMSQLPKDGGKAYGRALFWGIGAALVGLALYSIIGIMTGMIFGLVSLAVGFLVGTGMMKGSGGIGGRKYQITAVLLTYAAVSLSAIPIGIYYYMEEQKKLEAVIAEAEKEAAKETDEAKKGAAEETDSSVETVGLGSILGTLILTALASPFMELGEFPGGLIGLVILFVGLQIAWSKTGGSVPSVMGPFRNEPAGST